QLVPVRGGPITKNAGSRDSNSESVRHVPRPAPLPPPISPPKPFETDLAPPPIATSLLNYSTTLVRFWWRVGWARLRTGLSGVAGSWVFAAFAFICEGNKTFKACQIRTCPKQ